MRYDFKIIKPWQKHLFGILLLTALISFLLVAVNLKPLEYKYYDWLAAHFPTTEVSEDIVIVQLTPETLKKYNEKIPLKVHKEIFDSLLKHEPLKVVVFADSSNFFFFHANIDDQVRLMKSYGDRPIAFAINDIFYKEAVESPMIDYKFIEVPLEGWPMALDKGGKIRDGVCRRAIWKFADKNLEIFALAQKLAPSPLADDEVKGTFDYFNSKQIFTRYAKTGAFTTLSYKDLLDKKVNLSRLRNKLILVGRFNPELTTDFADTPQSTINPNSSSAFGRISALEVRANILNTLIKNQAVQEVPKMFMNSILFLFCLVGCITLFYVRPNIGPLIVVTMGLGLLAASVVVFFFKGLYLSIVPAEIGLFASYFLLLPYRLILETQNAKQEQQHFARQVGHDIQSPLSALKVVNSLLKDIPDNQKALMDQAVGRIENIASELLGEEKIAAQSTDLNQAIENLLLEKKWELQKYQNITMDHQVTNPNRPVVSLVSEHSFKRVLSNLINNAAESYRGGEGTVIVRTSQDRDFNIVEIEDKGCGMSAAALEKLGVKSFSEGKNGKGHGLGVISAFKFAKNAQGTLTFQSVLGQGTKAILKLPRV